MRAAEPKLVSSGHAFLEGPRWLGDRLFVSDFYTHRVLAFSASGAATTICDVPGRPSGLGFTAEGHMLVVSMTDRRLLRLTPGGLAEVADLSSLAEFPCNDAIVDADGVAYVGNFGWDPQPDAPRRATRLIRVDPHGQARAVGGPLVFPNGMARTIGGELLVAETFASRITAFKVAADGDLIEPRTWAMLGDGRRVTIRDALADGAPLPDGLALDAEGALWVGDAGGRAALRIAEGGRVLQRVETGDLTPYAVALGGSDGRTLFLCCAPPLLSHDPSRELAGALLCVRVDAPAAP